MADVIAAAHRALVGNTTQAASQLRAALPPIEVAHQPIESRTHPPFSATWHNGETYTTYWLGQVDTLLRATHSTENERERLQLAAREASANGSHAYAVGISHSTQKTSDKASVEIMGLIIMRPILYAGTEYAVQQLREKGMTLLYASNDTPHTVETLAHLACIVPRATQPIQHATRALPLDRTVYAGLTPAEKKRITAHYPSGSTYEITEPLVDFLRGLEATTH